MPSRIQGWRNGIGIQVQSGQLDHLVQVSSTANRIKSQHLSFLYHYAPIVPFPLEVFGPSVGSVGDCIALRPLDHCVRVCSSANRIKRFCRNLLFLYHHTPIVPPPPFEFLDLPLVL